MSETARPPVTTLPDIDAQGIMQLIPHRFPMLLIDRLTQIEAPVRAVGIKAVTINEPFFPGHFPTDPIMPGVLIVEAMAQAAAALVMAGAGRAGKGDLVYFLGIENARFRRPVRPGDLLELEVVRQKAKLNIHWYQGRALVDGKLCADAMISARLLQSEDASKDAPAPAR
jgi:3-hydroxyacyl-[acyl-carrier-protein] dehydratase